MNNYFYSASENGFVDGDKKEVYERAGTWPTDAVEVDAATFVEFTGLPPDGKVRIAGDDGMPAWGDVPAKSQAEMVAEAEETRQQLVDTAMQSVSTIQLKLQVGRTLTDAEATKLNIVLDYIDAVNAIDTTSAPDINWPVPPEA
ncbi:tail fiber assembly protein [Citrobacter amalonaticus]|uniref:tail fiber assembly protein n=1 Tax=Citrobacter sp. CFNIH10 TaxID=1920110 RepID=UPI000CEB8DB9|nr:tail fiber assembly protein [Citrobacter sp. CFNIH10]AUZ66618.1 tail fiber assembly protein [Citrobacter sp. CFNIH10]AUZ67329.1 tail fiber assembly protein [Citrobacter sp. CFNIH10]